MKGGFPGHAIEGQWCIYLPDNELYGGIEFIDAEENHLIAIAIFWWEMINDGWIVRRNAPARCAVDIPKNPTRYEVYASSYTERYQLGNHMPPNRSIKQLTKWAEMMYLTEAYREWT